MSYKFPPPRATWSGKTQDARTVSKGWVWLDGYRGDRHYYTDQSGKQYTREDTYETWGLFAQRAQGKMRTWVKSAVIPK